MKRDIRLSEKLLLGGYSFILLFMIVQDFVPLGSLNDVEAIAKVKTFNELITVTLIGVLQILLLMGIIIFFMGKRYPLLIKLWLIIHPSFIFGGALMAWWIPYIFGIGAADRMESYQEMFGNTHAFLPIMNGIVPNTLHTIFHITLLSCIILAIYISLTDSKKKKNDQNAVHKNIS